MLKLLMIRLRAATLSFTLICDLQTTIYIHIGIYTRIPVKDSKNSFRIDIFLVKMTSFMFLSQHRHTKAIFYFLIIPIPLNKDSHYKIFHPSHHSCK